MARLEPASIRYKNPGAIWGGALTKKWGSTRTVKLNDGTGQGNTIGVFDTYVQGICAQLDLWRSSKHYKNKKFKDAIRTWSGGNHVESYIKFVIDRVPGITRDTVMNDAFWQSEMGIQFLKAQAWHEAGKKYPAPDADFREAHRIVFNGKVSKPAPTSKPTPQAPTETKPWYKRIWLWVTGGAAAGGAGLTFGEVQTQVAVNADTVWATCGLIGASLVALIIWTYVIPPRGMVWKKSVPVKKKRKR